MMRSQEFARQLKGMFKAACLYALDLIHTGLGMLSILIVMVGGVLALSFDLIKLAFFGTNGLYAGLIVLCIGMALSALGSGLALLFPKTLMVAKATGIGTS
jgi:hypothetical protein